MTEKRCRKCLATKPFSAFHRDKYKKDGKNNRCITCVYTKVKDPKPPGRKKSPEKKCPRCLVIKTRNDFYDNKAGISWLCKLCVKDYRQDGNGHESVLRAAKKFRDSPAGREYRRSYMRKFGAKYREKYKAEGKIKARSLARYHVKKLPCKVCGDKKTQAHHHDYSKPLDVTWLCSKHHSETHHGFAPLD